MPEKESHGQMIFGLKQHPLPVSPATSPLPPKILNSASIVFFFLKIYLFIICKYTVFVLRYSKRALDIVTDGCEPPCGCWDLNSGPSEEQLALLTTEPSCQPLSLHSLRKHFP
jgi:hypothetical protein